MAAIYMWPKGDQLILTTTLYPVDYAEWMQITCAPVDETGWWPLPTDYLYVGPFAPSNGVIYSIRFTAPEQGPETLYAGFIGPGNGVIYPIRFDAPEQGPETLYVGPFNPSNGEIALVMIRADSPDEMLELTCSIETDSTMTLV